MFFKANPAFCRMLGYAPEEMNEKTFLEVTHPEHRDTDRENVERLWQGQIPCYRTEKRYLAKNGEIRWGSLSASLIQSREGKPLCALAIVEDITARKQAEQALRESEQTARALLNAPGMSALLIDREGVILGLNRTLAESLEKPEGTLIGQPAWGLFPPPVAKARKTALKKVLHSRQVLRHEEESQGHWSDTVIYPILDPDGNVQKIAILARDITEQKHAREQAKQRQAELLHVSRLSTLGEMASGFAHELNQPLSAILSYASASRRSMNDPDLDRERLKKNLEQMASQAERAGEIIKRVRSFAQRRPPCLGPIHIHEVVQEVLAFLHSDVVHKEVHVVLDLCENLPRVSADSIQLEQALLNLVRNAIEAMETTEPQDRRLTIRTLVSAPGTIRVTVSDTGVGLRPDLLPRIFDPFFTTKADGLGIGLSITRSIIELHRGQLWVEPGSGRGCTFAFTLPAAPDDPPRE